MIKNARFRTGNTLYRHVFYFTETNNIQFTLSTIQREWFFAAIRLLYIEYWLTVNRNWRLKGWRLIEVSLYKHTRQLILIIDSRVYRTESKGLKFTETSEETVAVLQVRTMSLIFTMPTLWNEDQNCVHIFCFPSALLSHSTCLVQE
jgi:hypothetical protein